MTSARLSTLAFAFLAACGVDPPPPAVPATATPAPATASAPASSSSSGPSAAPSPAPSPSPSSVSSSTSPPPASGPVHSADDAIARALPAADAALRAAYGKSKSFAVGGPHPKPFVTAAEARATQNGTSFTVKWSRHPPAGFEIEAVVTVSSNGTVTVTKAEATFSPD